MVYREACALHLWKWSFREDVCTEARALLIVKAEFKLLNLRQIESRLIWPKTKIELVTGLVRGLEESRINIVCDDSVLLCSIMVVVIWALCLLFLRKKRYMPERKGMRALQRHNLWWRL